jgi:hypothetical protein
MECDQPTPLVQFVDSPSSHDILDFEFPLEETILEVMASIDKPKEYEDHSILPDLKPMRVSMMSIDSRLGTFVGESSRPPSLNPFLPQIYFSKLATELSASPSIEDSHFITPSHLDGSYHRASIAHQTTHDEYLQS